MYNINKHIKQSNCFALYQTNLNEDDGKRKFPCNYSGCSCARRMAKSLTMQNRGRRQSTTGSASGFSIEPAIQAISSAFSNIIKHDKISKEDNPDPIDIEDDYSTGQ